MTLKRDPVDSVTVRGATYLRGRSPSCEEKKLWLYSSNIWLNLTVPLFYNPMDHWHRQIKFKYLSYKDWDELRNSRDHAPQCPKFVISSDLNWSRFVCEQLRCKSENFVSTYSIITRTGICIWRNEGKRDWRQEWLKENSKTKGSWNTTAVSWNRVER